MPEVLVPVLIPYARFLEYRTRRLGIVTGLTQPDGQQTINVAVSSAPRANDEQARAAVRVFATGPTAGVQQS